MDGRMPSIAHSVQGPLGLITLRNQPKRNALTAAMWHGIPAAMQALCADSRVLAIVVRGEGADFGSGADLTEIVEATESLEKATAYCRMVAGTLLAVARCPVPTWALMHGNVIGGAAEVALACDARVATPSARFLLPFARLGVVPDLFTVRRLANVLGHGRARRLLMEPTTLDAATCLDMGLVDTVIEEEQALENLAARATRMGSLAKAAVSQIKTQMLEVSQAEIEPAIADMVASLTQGEVRTRAQAALAR